MEIAESLQKATQTLAAEAPKDRIRVLTITPSNKIDRIDINPSGRQKLELYDEGHMYGHAKKIVKILIMSIPIFDKKGPTGENVIVGIDENNNKIGVRYKGTELIPVASDTDLFSASASIFEAFFSGYSDGYLTAVNIFSKKNKPVQVKSSVGAVCEHMLTQDGKPVSTPDAENHGKTQSNPQPPKA